MNSEGIKYFNRIAETARLTGVKGSVSKRNSLAARANQKLYKANASIIRKRFEQSGEAFITAKEFGANFDKQIRNIESVLIPNKDKTSNGNVDFLYAEKGLKKISGFLLSLPLKVIKDESIITSESTRTVMHELRHILDFLYQPKILARNQKTSCHKNALKNIKFYRTYLYIKEQENAERRIPDVKEKLKKHFRNTRLDKRIDIMQHWRYLLQSESNAYKDGNFYELQQTFDSTKVAMAKNEQIILDTDISGCMYDSAKYPTLIEKQKGLERFKKEVNEIGSSRINAKYLFDEKIKMLEEMIFDYIAKSRKKFRNN